MSKWIVGLLLLGNLALFGWMRWGSLLTGDADAVPPLAALNPDKIRLLGTQPASAPASAPAPVSAVPAVVPAPASAPVPVAAHAPASAPASSVPAAAPIPAATVSGVVSGRTNCAEWGEFSGSDLARSRHALASMNLGDKLSERNVEHKLGYWVYIPPLKKRADLPKKVAQLKERGVKDYFVVQEKGKWQNAISLGIFKTRESAEKYLAVLRSKDVRSAKMGERMSKLKFTVFAMKDLDAATTGKINALKNDFPGSDLRVSACAN